MHDTEISGRREFPLLLFPRILRPKTKKKKKNSIVYNMIAKQSKAKAFFLLFFLSFFTPSLPVPHLLIIARLCRSI